MFKKPAPNLGVPMKPRAYSQDRLVENNLTKHEPGSQNQFASTSSRYQNSNQMFGILSMSGNPQVPSKPSFLNPAVDPYDFFNSRLNVVDQLPSVKSNWWVTRDKDNR